MTRVRKTIDSVVDSIEWFFDQETQQMDFWNLVEIVVTCMPTEGQNSMVRVGFLWV